MNPRPGKNSSEFWLTLAYGVIFALNGSAYLNVPWDQMIVLAGVFGVYSGGRSFVKGKAAQASPQEEQK